MTPADEFESVEMEKEAAFAISRRILQSIAQGASRDRISEDLIELSYRLSLIKSSKYCTRNSRKDIEILLFAFKNGNRFRSFAYEHWFRNHLKELMFEVQSVELKRKRIWPIKISHLEIVLLKLERLF